jgi:hypothetical protein
MMMGTRFLTRVQSGQRIEEALIPSFFTLEAGEVTSERRRRDRSLQRLRQINP